MRVHKISSRYSARSKSQLPTIASTRNPIRVNDSGKETQLEKDALTAGKAIHLQQTIGNRRFGQLLRQQNQPAPPVIQRQPKPQTPTATTDDLNEHIRVIYETQLPWEIWRLPENATLSKAEEEEILVRRKLRAISALGDLGDQRAVITLVAILDDTIFGVKRLAADNKKELEREAIEALGKIGGPTALAALETRLGSKDVKTRELAMLGLVHARGGEAASILLKRLNVETDEFVKSRILFALGEIGSQLTNAKHRKRVVHALIDELKVKPAKVAVNAVTALGKMKDKDATQPLLDFLKLWQSISQIAEAVVIALGEIGDKEALDYLIIMFEKHKSAVVRRQAAIALGKIGGAKARKSLLKRSKEETDKAVKAEIDGILNPPRPTTTGPKRDPLDPFHRRPVRD